MRKLKLRKNFLKTRLQPKQGLNISVDICLEYTPPDIIFRVMEQTRGRKAKERLDEIKSLYKLGKISYDHAKELAEEYLVVLNEEMERIAREFKRKHKKVGFVGFMR